MTRRLRMSDSAQRAEFETLTRECLEQGQDRTAWQSHMLAGLHRLLQAEASLAIEIMFAPEQPVIQSCVVRDGLTEEVWCELSVSGDPAINPFLPAIMACGQPVLTIARQDMVTDPIWKRSRMFDEYLRPAALNESMAFIWFEQPLVQVIALHRPLNARQFDTCEVTLLDDFSRNLLLRWGARLTGAEGLALRGLPTRLRQVLECLIQGDSEKQIALRLGLSRHTVHAHTKRLYKYFEATSRGELYARTERLFPPQGRILCDSIPLTARQREVLTKVRSGASEKEIARSLDISPHTVRFHVRELYRLFGVASRGKLLAASAEHGGPAEWA